jgi:hypothetical protein
VACNYLLGFVTFPVKMGLLNMPLATPLRSWILIFWSKYIVEKMVFVSIESYYFVLMRISQSQFTG